MADVRSDTACVVLAAGYGRRMNSRLPKVLHEAAGRPLLVHVLAALQPLRPNDTVLVVPRDHEAIREAVAASGMTEVTYAVQPEPLGTADAVRAGLGALGRREGSVLVVPGDHPLLEASTLESMLAEHRSAGAAATLLTCRLDDPRGRGRVVRGDDGGVVRIVEDKDANEEELLIDEINGGIYVFDAARLSRALEKVDRENAQGEYYLTDVVRILKTEGDGVIAHLTDTYDAFGVNSRVHLAQSGALLRQRICGRWMEEGVTIVDPDSTFIDASVIVGTDVVLHPFTFLEGETTVGDGAEIGPNARIVDSTIGERAEVSFAVVRGSDIGDHATVGPYASLRPGTKLASGAHIGTFVETKSSTIGEGSKVPHLSYMGDATVGRGVNVGAGTITCNWDGRRKNPSVIEDDAYISSDTMLVAPVRIGKRAATGAGSVVNKDVPDDALAVGVPVRILEGRGDKMQRGKQRADAPEGDR